MEYQETGEIDFSDFFSYLLASTSHTQQASNFILTSDLLHYELCWWPTALSFLVPPAKSDIRVRILEANLSSHHSKWIRNTFFLSADFESSVECHKDRNIYIILLTHPSNSTWMRLLSSSCLKISCLYLVYVLSTLISSAFSSILWICFLLKFLWLVTNDVDTDMVPEVGWKYRLLRFLCLHSPKFFCGSPSP